MDIISFKLNPFFKEFINLTDEELLAMSVNVDFFIKSVCCSMETNEYAKQLMLAHLLKLSNDNLEGGSSITTSASEGSVSVSLLAPPVANQYQYWMNLSPYGQMLYNLVKSCTKPFYVGGSYARSGVRKSNGRF